MRAVAAREMSAFLDSWLAYRARHASIPGFGVAIVAGDEVVFNGAYGLADVASGVPLTTDHLFGISSQSKMFTATALLQLVEQDRVQLDHVVVRYLPWLAEHADPRFAGITLRQLLAHSSGLGREGDDADHWQLTKPFPGHEELRALVLAMPMAVQTNARVKYSNVGFALLGAVIEAVTGTPFAEHITRCIIGPLGLRSTVADHAPSLAGRVATGYSLPFAHERIPLTANLSSNTYAAVMGVYATAEDMCRFAQAHFWGDPRLIGDPLKREAQRTQWMVMEGNDFGREYGLGFEVMRAANRRLVGHSGGFSGYQTGTFFEPEERLALSVMANGGDAPVVEMLRGLVEVIDHFHRYATAETPADRARLNARVFSALATVEIRATAGTIVATNPDTWSPFAQAEELEVVEGDTLRVVTPNSYFNEGELVQPAFAGDSVASVRFAGITLLPERDYRQYAQLQHRVGEHRSVADGGNSDLDHGPLCTGIVVAVETCDASWPWHHRLVIEYGDGIGLRRCFTNALPSGLAAKVVGRRALGVVYPLQWHFGARTEEVMTLGVARGPGSGAALQPGMVIPLAATADDHRTLPHELSEGPLTRSDERAQHAFKFEPLSDYPDLHDLDPSLAAWLQGDRDGARVLMERKKLPGAFGYPLSARDRVWVRVTDEILTPYVEWELEVFARVQVPTYGDTVYLLPRRAMGGLDAPSGDVAIFDHRCAYINGYDGRDGSLQYRTIVDADQGDSIADAVHLETRLTQLAQARGRKVAPVP